MTEQHEQWAGEACCMCDGQMMPVCIFDSARAKGAAHAASRSCLAYECVLCRAKQSIHCQLVMSKMTPIEFL